MLYACFYLKGNWMTQNQNVLFSIIVPVYNIATYVRKCIESIICQTYKNLDIILVDDGSTDGSGDICDKYADKDSRIRVVHKKNGGLVSARKAGITVAEGVYSLYVDGDDWIEEDYIEIVSKHVINKPDAIISLGHTREYSGNQIINYSDGTDTEHRFYSGSEIEEIIIRKLLLKILYSWINSSHHQSRFAFGVTSVKQKFYGFAKT